MLDDKKLQLVTLIMGGESKTVIAKKLNVSRQTIYSWLDDPEVKGEIKKRQKELIQSGKDLLTSRLTGYLDNLHTIATTSKDTRTKASVNMYLVDRVLGKVSTIGEGIPNDDKHKVDNDMLADVFSEVDGENLKLVK